MRRPPRSGGPRGRLLHRHRRPGRPGHGRHPLARSTWRGPACAQRSQRTLRSSDASDLAALANGTEIVFVAGDIASPGVAERLVAAAEETGRPLRGLVHAAGVTGDGLVTALTREGHGAGVGAQGGRRVAAARGDGHPTARLVGRLLLDGLAARFAGSTGLRDRECLARRADDVATRVRVARHRDQLGPVVGRRDESVADLQRARPDHARRRHRGAGVAGRRPLTRVGVGRLRLDRAVAATPEFRDLGYFETVASRSSTAASVEHEAIPVGPGSIRGRRAPDWSHNVRRGPARPNCRPGCGPSWPANCGCRRRRSSVDAAVPRVGPRFDDGDDGPQGDASSWSDVDVSANMLFNHPTISSLASVRGRNCLHRGQRRRMIPPVQTIRTGAQRAG